MHKCRHVTAGFGTSAALTALIDPLFACPGLKLEHFTPRCIKAHPAYVSLSLSVSVSVSEWCGGWG